MDLSVVIVNWNSGDCLSRLMRSLQPLVPDARQVIVVDNDSTDDSLGSLEFDERIRLVRFPRNRGFAGGANAGISLAPGRFVLLLNPDIVVVPEQIRNLYDQVRRDGNAAIACPLLRDRNGSAQVEFQLRRLPTPWSILRDALFLDELFALFRRSSPPSLPQSRQPVEQPAAAFWMLRKTAWEELGGFDERFHPAWFEDVDFCKRLAGTHWKIYCYPGCFAYHSGGISVQKLGRKGFTSIYYRNLLRYVRKHHPFAFPFLWLPVWIGIRVRTIRPGER